MSAVNDVSEFAIVVLAVVDACRPRAIPRDAKRVWDARVKLRHRCNAVRDMPTQIKVIVRQMQARERGALPQHLSQAPSPVMPKAIA